MRVAITGGTGFLGRYIVRQLAIREYRLRCWRRPTSDVSGFDMVPDGRLEWVDGSLGDADAAAALVHGVDAVVHAALDRPGAGFRGAEGDVVDFARRNIVGTLQLIQAAVDARVERFVFISTCAVHEVILEDHPLNETHPLWPTSHYGAHKAAIEKFVHSYGLGDGFPICALRPTGIYGLAHPPQESKWWDLVRAVGAGEKVHVESRGGKEVHAADVAKAVDILLEADEDAIRGQAFNCYDRYISDYDVACMAKEVSGSKAELKGESKRPQNQINTDKLRALGMKFGGEDRLRQTVQEILAV